MPEGAAVTSLELRVATTVMPLREGDPSGDAALHLAQPGGALLAIVDGLGHGAAAAQAAQTALQLITRHATQALPALLATLNGGLSATRGAAIGLMRIAGSRLQYAGIGNTRALRWRGAQKLHLSPQNGIVGSGSMPKAEVVELDLQRGDWLLLFTDGLDEMLQLGAHLPEWERDPALLCAHLLARWRHVRDDAGVLVCHVGGGGE